MQVTIDLPDELAAHLNGDHATVPEILARGLRRGWSSPTRLRREVVSFLASQPSCAELLAFRPSKAASARARQLLRKNQEKKLSAEEEAELDEICELDRFVGLIKSEMLKRRRAK